jgi:hypothetical protein
MAVFGQSWMHQNVVKMQDNISKSQDKLSQKKHDCLSWHDEILSDLMR